MGWVAGSSYVGQGTTCIRLACRQQAWWRNGSASDSRSEGCVFKSRPGQCHFDRLNSLMAGKLQFKPAAGHDMHAFMYSSNQDVALASLSFGLK